jgi:hypothetical protein
MKPLLSYSAVKGVPRSLTPPLTWSRRQDLNLRPLDPQGHLQNLLTCGNRDPQHRTGPLAAIDSSSDRSGYSLGSCFTPAPAALGPVHRRPSTRHSCGACCGRSRGTEVFPAREAARKFRDHAMGYQLSGFMRLIRTTLRTDAATWRAFENLSTAPSSRTGLHFATAGDGNLPVWWRWAVRLP